MEIQVVNALVSINHAKQEGNTQIYKQGPDAITVPEVLVLMQLHGESSVSMLKEVTTIEISHADERERLMEKYGEEIVMEVYPGIRSPMPKTIKDLDLPTEALDRRKQVSSKGDNPDGDMAGQAPNVIAAAKGKLIAELDEMGIKVIGDATLIELQKAVADAKAKVAA